MQVNTDNSALIGIKAQWGRESITVVPLLKYTLDKGHLSNSLGSNYLAESAVNVFNQTTSLYAMQ